MGNRSKYGRRPHVYSETPPGFSPWTVEGRIEAVGRIARAAKYGTGGRHLADAVAVLLVSIGSNRYQKYR